MKDATLIRNIQASLLIVALLFGQVGAGFLHNDHDAHQNVTRADVESDATTIVAHGDHCKVCAADWVNQFMPASEVRLTADHSVDIVFCPKTTAPTELSGPGMIGRSPPISA